MAREIIISVIIVISVFIIDFTTSRYTEQTISEFEQDFKEIRFELEKKESIKKEYINNKMEKIKEKWQKKYEKLAFYIEHDELEKVETEIYNLKANIDTDEYEEAIEKIEKCRFILKHIENKETLSIKNIF